MRFRGLPEDSFRVVVFAENVVAVALWLEAEGVFAMAAGNAASFDGSSVVFGVALLVGFRR